MLGHRRQYRILLIALVFALIMGAFYAAYQGAHHWDAIEARALTLQIKGGQPRPFSWEWTVGDPVAFFTLALAIAMFALFCITVWMARSTDKVANQSVATLVATERPYLTGGGGFYRRGQAMHRECFRSMWPTMERPRRCSLTMTFSSPKSAGASSAAAGGEANPTGSLTDRAGIRKPLRKIPFHDDIDVIFGSFGT